MSPSRNHAYVHTKLAGALLDYEEEYSILTELTVDVNSKEYTPDIAIYPYLDINIVDDIIKMSDIPLSIIEILSPTQGTQELIDKFKACFQAGVKSCWLVVPPTRTITVYSNNINQSTTFSDEEVIDNRLGIKIHTNKIFPNTMQKKKEPK